MQRLGAQVDAGSSLGRAVERARYAEGLGYDSIWTAQMPDARDTSIVLAAYADATERAGLGTAVLPVYTRHPTAMAQMAATLDELAGGRFRLGIGISHKVTVERMWGLRLESPVEAMREYLTIVRSSVRDGSASFEGRHFSAKWAYSAPRRPDMPILISALNPRMLELAGELADGVVLWMCSPAYVRDQVVPRVRAGRERAGKDVDGFEVAALVPVSLSSDAKAARDVFRTSVRRYAGLPFYRRMMDASGFADELARDEVSDAMLDQLAGIGDEDAVRGILQRYRQAGCTLPIASPFNGHEGAQGVEATLKAAISA